MNPRTHILTLDREAPRRKEIVALLPLAEKRLQSCSGIRSVGVGYKTVAGQQTSDLAFLVLVDQKQDVDGDGKVPAVVEGVKTDVIGFETIDLTQRPAAVGIDFDRYGTLQGGIGIARFRDQDEHDACDGTLGIILANGGEPRILSAFHVLIDTATVEEDPPPEFWITQPFLGMQNAIGTSLFDLDGLGVDDGQGFDCAVGTLDDEAERRDEARVSRILDIGAVAGPAEPVVGMIAAKRGCITGLTYGLVTHVGVSVRVRYNGPEGPVVVRLPGQFLIQGTPGVFAQGGDSGSVVVSDPHVDLPQHQRPPTNAIGLLVSDTAQNGVPLIVATPMQPILARLGVAF